jgi:Mor family transcriptional regulator
MRIIMIVFLVTMIISNSSKQINKTIYKNYDAKNKDDLIHEYGISISKS